MNRLINGMTTTHEKILTKRGNKVSVFDLYFQYFDLVSTVVSSNRIRTLLASEEADLLRGTGRSFPNDVTPSSFLIHRIELEDQQ